MTDHQDIGRQEAAAAAPEGVPAVARPSTARRRMLVAGLSMLALVGAVSAFLSPTLRQMSEDWGLVPAAVSPVAAQTPPAIAATGREAIDRHRMLLAADRERLHRLADRAVDTAVRIEFGAMRLRAPVYAHWAYGWVQSYVVSYQIIGRALMGAFQHATSGKPGSPIDAATEEATNVVREHFQALVVQPERTQKALDGEWDRVTDLLNREFDLIERRQSDAIAAATGTRPTGESQQLPPAQDRGGLSVETPDINAVLLRSARPMAARAGIVMLRLTEIGSIAAIVSSLGITFGPLTGIVVGVVGGVGIAWGIDYIVNRIDAELHRDELESHVVTFVEALENETRQRLTALFKMEIDERFSAIEASLNRAFP